MKNRFVAGIALVCFCTGISPAATQRNRGTAQSRRSSPALSAAGPLAKSNPEIRQILGRIDARNIEATIRKLVSFGTRNSLSDQASPTRGVGAAVNWLYSEFVKASQSSGGRMTVSRQEFDQAKGSRIPEPVKMTNIVASLKGTQAESADRYYVVSGHYDSMCTSPVDAKCDAPGANDDASGTAAVLEMARAMAPYKFDATIVFMTVPGEEQGLYGSTHFAEEAKKQSLDIEGMLDNDIIGSSLGGNGIRDRNHVRVFSEGVPSNETPAEANVRRGVGGENDSASRQLARFIRDVGLRYMPAFNVTMVYRRDRYLRGGDHIPFLERGYPAVRFTEPNENYHHQHQNVRIEEGVQYGDLPEFDDFGYIAQVARLNAATLASLALAPAAPKNAVVLTRNLTNDTDLQWNKNPEPDLAGYEVVWRDTTSPVWTNSVWVGSAEKYTAKGMSKDNYFFGVRAVDRDGNRSPISYPKPSR